MPVLAALVTLSFLSRTCKLDHKLDFSRGINCVDVVWRTTRTYRVDSSAQNLGAVVRPCPPCPLSSSNTPPRTTLRYDKDGCVQQDMRAPRRRTDSRLLVSSCLLTGKVFQVPSASTSSPSLDCHLCLQDRPYADPPLPLQRNARIRVCPSLLPKRQRRPRSRPRPWRTSGQSGLTLVLFVPPSFPPSLPLAVGCSRS